MLVRPKSTKWCRVPIADAGKTVCQARAQAFSCKFFFLSYSRAMTSGGGTEGTMAEILVQEALLRLVGVAQKSLGRKKEEAMRSTGYGATLSPDCWQLTREANEI